MSSSCSRATSSRARPAERRHVLRHGVRAGVPRRHRGGARPRRPTSSATSYAFPIPQTMENIERLRARREVGEPRRPRPTVVNTSNWCDPAKQAEAAKSLLDQGVDVITQHQDCTTTISKTAEAAGAILVGYHADASGLAPKGWITGSEWNWGPLYTDIVKHDPGRQLHRQQVQRQLPGRPTHRRQPVRAVEVRLDGHGRHARPRSTRRRRSFVEAARRSPGRSRPRTAPSRSRRDHPGLRLHRTDGLPGPGGRRDAAQLILHPPGGTGAGGRPAMDAPRCHRARLTALDTTDPLQEP